MVELQENYGQPTLGDLPNGPMLKVLLSGIIGLSVIGFLIALNKPEDVPVERALPSARAVAEVDVVDSLSYAEVGRQSLRPSRGAPGSLADLVQSKVPAVMAAGSPERARAKALTQAKRRSLRAFAGAPPRVPHPVDARSSASCLACHGEGLRIGDQIASKMPHALYASCTQCHVQEEQLQPEEHTWLANHFQGSFGPGEGGRAWTGAPPTLPHGVEMRTDCLACHGPNGQPGLRTTHPERKSCLQCHAMAPALKLR